MNAIDLFSGAGGLSIALRDSGYKVLLANEISPIFAKSHSHNFPEVPLIQMDIKELDELVKKVKEIDMAEVKENFLNKIGFEFTIRHNLPFTKSKVASIMSPSKLPAGSFICTWLPINLTKLFTISDE
mgnify:CR=1 FL=1